MKHNNKETKIIEKIDRAISELVYDKTQIIKAYNYYHGKRDPEQFRHLEENYGIGTATSIEFIPLVRKHIDVLVGEYLSIPLLPKISCKDSNTLSNINRDKQLKLNSEIVSKLKEYLRNSIYSFIQGKQNITDIQIEKELQNIRESINENFISEYELAGQNIIDYTCQSRSSDLLNKRKILLLDLLIAGIAYYRVSPSSNNTNIQLKVLNPLNTFIDRNPESPYLNNSPRAVVREYMTKNQILSVFGNDLNTEDLDSLDKLEDLGFDDSTTTYIRSYDSYYSGTSGTQTSGILGGFEITPLIPYDSNTSKYFRTYPVYFVEWLQADKDSTGKYITNRYEGVRIGSNIYLPTGKSENVIRSMDDTATCSLSVNGLFVSDRNGDPISLVLSTANLQDKYDILHFYRDNIISESGTVGDWVDVAHLPAFLGKDVPEKLIKWKAYSKSGLKVYDSSQEGPVINTAFNGFDDTIKVQTIQAIDLAIQRTEETCSGITGVFRERLGGIEQKDAVTNVEVGIRNSSYITKQYYQLMDLLTREMLLDILNISKIVYKNGITGTLILGERLNKIFTALPEHYTITDFDIHINDSSEIIKEQETIRQLTYKFADNNQIEPDIVLDIITAKSLTGMKIDVKKSLNKKKEESGQLQQLSSQLEQVTNQLKEVTANSEKLQQKLNQLNEEKLQIERDKLKSENELEWFKAKSSDSFNSAKLELDQKRVELEGLQLIDINKKNDEIKNN